MGLVEERKREPIEVFAQFMEGLVGNHGNSIDIREMCLDFCRSF
jgi:hypothetical protein